MATVIVMGFVFNQGHVYSFLIKYLLMGMLFFPFLRISFPKQGKVYLSVSGLFSVMAGLGVSLYLLLGNFNKELAIIGFLLAFTPTATAAPVVMGLLHKNVEYVVTSVVFTNLLVAVSLPLALKVMHIDRDDASLQGMLGSTVTVFFVPLVLACLARFCFAKQADSMAAGSRTPLLIWLLVLYLATAKASVYLFDSPASWTVVMEIALLALLLCLLNFSIGYYLGGEKFAAEASQSLGQKNTMFMTWAALEFVSPIAALGPVFYLVFQNIYNAVLLSRHYRPR